MNEIIETQSGTKLLNGIEYNEYPPPASIIKATELKWAKKLRSDGLIRLYSVRYYQVLENPELGDANESCGMLRHNGNPMEIGSTNEVFIWCSAMPNTSIDVLKSLDKTYDTIIRISNVEEFASRIMTALKELKYTFLPPHLGQVKYNRGEEVSQETLNNQKWHCNIFQKSSEFVHQNEYRMSFVNISSNQISKEYLDINIGNCNDIVQI
ncbi:MAG: hypothetical protein K8F52_18615 [Candidatus Scalindua rubra]|uniref:Uncharacterized protein n=1 Tax=Candidatus Scalindua brodae TaxID=237368 RepID=A0A0B0EI68_9BACT|nr:MAG: hypothetical protein SCABRO_03942 [Candidatus Scalindua brodae]MBZ0110671.1 hypothetical protein [Candidatus Scalindua rubra]